MNTPTELIDDLRLLEGPHPWRINYWLVALGVAVLAVGWWYLRRWLAKRAARAAEDAMLAAHDDALAQLEQLFALIDQELSRPYAIESSAIIRRYIEVRFQLAAPQRSTEEFLEEAQHSPKLELRYQTLLGEFLRYCDLLKFARTFADRAELQELHAAAVHFVKETVPSPHEVAAT